MAIVRSHQFKDVQAQGLFKCAVPSATGGSQALGTDWAATLQQADPWAVERLSSFVEPSFIFPLNGEGKRCSMLPRQLVLSPLLEAFKTFWIKQRGIILLWTEGCTGDFLQPWGPPPTMGTSSNLNYTVILWLKDLLELHVQVWGGWKQMSPSSPGTELHFGGKLPLKS